MTNLHAHKLKKSEYICVCMCKCACVCTCILMLQGFEILRTALLLILRGTRGITLYEKAKYLLTSRCHYI